MGKEGCLHILLGAYPRLAALDSMHVFLPHYLFVSNLFGLILSFCADLGIATYNFHEKVVKTQ